MIFNAVCETGIAGISSTEQRNVQENFIVSGSQFYLIESPQGFLTPLEFSKETRVVLQALRIDPIGAQGLREGMSFAFDPNPNMVQINELEAGIFATPWYLPGFSKWFDIGVDLFPELLGLQKIKPGLGGVRIEYDAFNIKDDYKGKPYKVRVTARFEGIKA